MRNNMVINQEFNGRKTEMAEKNILVIMGGRSSEHEVSLVSAVTVIENIDTKTYNIIMVGITKEGRWKLIDSVNSIKDGSWLRGRVEVVLSADTVNQEILLIHQEQFERVHIDVIFPVLHGMNGRTEPSRVSSNWPISPMWAAESSLLPAPWINSIPRPSWIPSVSVRHAMWESAGMSLRTWMKWSAE